MKNGNLQDLRNKALCALLVIACLLAVWPILGMGVDDDWSYTFTAKHLAETGHLAYNGWAAFPLGVQAYWAALWIRMFGFSFTLVRLTTLPFGVGCAWLLYVMHRRIGVGPNLSLLGTLTVVLSPLFLPGVASFMSDVPSLFFFLLAVYGYARALEAPPQSPAAPRLLLAATLAGLLGCTIRQSVWLVPLLCLPYAAWLRRDNRRFVLAAGFLWLASAVAGAAILKWYAAQSYSVTEHLKGILGDIARHPHHFLRGCALMTLMLALLLCPVLAGGLFSGPWLRKLPLRTWALIALLLGLGLLGCALLHRFAPWQSSVLSVYGVYSDVFVIGTLPRALSQPVRAALSVLALLLAGLTWAWLASSATDPADAEWQPEPMPALLQMTLLAVGAYTLMALAREAVWDRYLLPVLPAASLALLWRARRRGDRVYAAGWAALGLWTLYGIAALHNHFALGRARCEGAALLTRAGIPRTQVLAGLDFDGWTQIEAQNHLNNALANLPPDTFHDRPDPTVPIEYGAPWFYNMIPAVTLRYAVVTSPQPALTNCRVAPIEYTAWLPPFHRSVLIQRVADAPEPRFAP